MQPEPQPKPKPMSLEAAQSMVGEEMGVSAWRAVTQDMIDQFANATDDHQFIHTDPERAALETPYGGTIAHGFLTLSMLSAMIYEVIPAFEGAAAGVNFGFESIRFLSPVKSGQRIRARFKLAKMRLRPSGIAEVAYDVAIELEGSIKPALTAHWLTLILPQRKD